MTENAPAATGLEQLRRLDLGEKIGIAQTMRFQVVEIEEGFVAVESEPGRHVYNPIGTVHGGYAATLLDTACGLATHSRLAAGQGYTTLELKVAYHKAMTDQTGIVRAEGRIVSMGRRVSFAEATLKDAAGRLLASATSTLMIL